MVSRADRSPIANWWWTIDKPMLFGLIALMFLGLILSFAASPSIAEQLGLESYFFVKRHAIFAIPALFMLLFVSFLNTKLIRRLALLMFIGGLLLLIYTLFAGDVVKGSRRWISIFGFSVQPSEIVKPAFIILVAWLFAENAKRPDIPGNVFAILLLAVFGAVLVAQPDIGQTALITLTWCVMFFMAGLSWLWIMVLGGMSIAGMTAAYLFVPHVTGRIDRFLNPESGDTYQVDKALEAFFSGGWFGRGPGEGVVKRGVPDSHTDFIFAIIGEEFGIIACLVLALFFLLLVMRGLYLGFRQEDTFVRLAVGGLIIMFGMQAGINMMVNLQLAPTKGMTLPFISYGGSSLVSVAIAMGMVLGLARKRPKQSRMTMTPHVPDLGANQQPA